MIDGYLYLALAVGSTTSSGDLAVKKEKGR
jgi:hypothetical protein